MKKKSFIAVPILLGLLAGGVGIFNANSEPAVTYALDLPTPNDTSACNCEAGATQAVTINYDGTNTIAYGVQSYAGVSGPAWYVGDLASVLEDGTQAHSVGSNSGDHRSGLTLTFKFESTVQGAATLALYVKDGGDVNNSNATVYINGKETSVNLTRASEGNDGWDQTTASCIPLLVKKGLNTVVLVMQQNYTAWFGSWEIREIHENKNTEPCNYEPEASDPVTIDYYGDTSLIYGIQSYAGVSGPVWILGNSAARVDDGSHAMGSNAPDWRSGFEMSFSINSNIAGDAYLDLFAEHDGYDSKAVLKVNDGDPQNIDLHSLLPIENNLLPTQIPVTLVKGLNKITVTMQNNYKIWVSSWRIGPKEDRVTIHDVAAFNFDTFKVDEAIPVNFDGHDFSKVWGAQRYAGVDGVVWVTGDQAPAVNDGVGSHLFGGYADKAGGLKLTFKINSAVEKDVLFNLFASFAWDGGDTAEQSNFTYKVNDAEPVSDCLYTIAGGQRSAGSPTGFDVSLKEGLNTIVLTFPGNYKVLFGGFSIGESGKVLDVSEVNVLSWSNKQGDMVTNQADIGLNAFDNAADYGKQGSVDYVFNVPVAGKYNLTLGIMEGNSLANRVGIDINGERVTINGKPYLEADYSAGWGPYTDNTIVVDLPEGLVTMTISNVLTRVNAEKTQEVPDGTEGSVLVSNWWMNKIKFEKRADEELVLDKTNAQTAFNLKRDFSAKGLVVKHVTYQGDTILSEDVLNSDEYTIDSSNYDKNKIGSYTIKVTETATGLTATYSVAVGNEGKPFEGKTIEFDGETAFRGSFYMNAKIEGEGTGDCEGRIFWFSPDWGLSDGGYQMGSHGDGESENRQITLTLNINAAKAGKYNLGLFILTDVKNNSILNMSVNGVAKDVDLFYSDKDTAANFLVDLNEGANTIKLKTIEKYAFWFFDFMLAPIQANALDQTLEAKAGYRDGGIIDSDNSFVWTPASAGNSSLSYAFNVEEDGLYELKVITPSGNGKKATLVVDGQDIKDFDIENGESLVNFELTAGQHIIGIKSSNGGFTVSSVKLSVYVAITGIELDLTGVNLEVEYDGIFDPANIVVNAKYSDGSSKKLLVSEYKIVEPQGFSTTKPGTYEFKVVLLSDESIFATFNVVVLDEVVPGPTSSSEPESITSEPESITSEPASSSEAGSSENEKPSKGGCGGSVAATSIIISTVALLGCGLMFSKRKEK